MRPEPRTILSLSLPLPSNLTFDLIVRILDGRWIFCRAGIRREWQEKENPGENARPRRPDLPTRTPSDYVRVPVSMVANSLRSMTPEPLHAFAERMRAQRIPRD